MRFPRWSEQSMALWVLLAMALCVLPLAASSLLTHVYLDGAALAAFDDTAVRYRDEVRPLHLLQVELGEAALPVEEYLDAGETDRPVRYRQCEARIEALFAQLGKTLADDARLTGLLKEAHDDWQAADQLCTELLTHPGASASVQNAATIDRIDELIGGAMSKVRDIDDAVNRSVSLDHTVALQVYERAGRLGWLSFGASVLFAMLGLVVIMRILLANVSRLVRGARLFAEGDRQHRIDVQTPPELRDIAHEFNRMAEQVQRAEEALAKQARQDVMTGLNNRRAFEEEIGNAYGRLRRMKEGFGLLIVDIDHFKKVNDTYGHAAGDAVLAATGRLLQRGIREVDTAYRIGGEEFVVILADVDESGARIAAERLRTMIAGERIAAEGKELSVTASIGFALADPATNSTDLMKAADDALYAAKKGGRNRVVSSGEVDLAPAV